MKQRTLAMMCGFERYGKKTWALFLEEIEQVLPWGKLLTEAQLQKGNSNATTTN